MGLEIRDGRVVDVNETINEISLEIINSSIESINLEISSFNERLEALFQLRERFIELSSSISSNLNLKVNKKG